ncbi:MAG TPA: DUF3180 domain-containing protein [Mycobacteriales bacterium]|nr:DUF3180 domain-containing protein [Mycobacteriales bacterium]
MRPTRLGTLAVVALVAALVTYLAFRALYGDLPPVPASMAATVFVLAVAELFLAPSVRARLEGRPRTKPIMPIAVARTAAFAKASSSIGALVAGSMAGAEAYVLRRSDLPAARVDAVRGGLVFAAALLLVVAALRLERVCRADPPPPDQSPPPVPGGP